MTEIEPNSIIVALAWCLAWGTQHQPQFALTTLRQMRQALLSKGEVPDAIRSLVQLVKQLQSIDEQYFPDTLEQLQQDYPELWAQNTPIGLVYGGATKIKGYVFESSKLSDIRGASALLDRINLIDLRAFFNQELLEEPESPDDEDSQALRKYCQTVKTWLSADDNFPHLAKALIPELIIYSTGGNILAFCPAAYVNDLANAIEKRYTSETLTANSCAVGDTFRLLEIRFGLLQAPIKNTLWLDWYRQNHKESIVESYYGTPELEQLNEAFKNRKSFNELAGKLAAQFNQRRNGNLTPNRPSRCYPPMFETHPYLIRDESDRASAFFHATDLPSQPWLSEPLARKHLVGQKAKRDNEQKWYDKTELNWQTGEAVESWVKKFEKFLEKTPNQYYRDCNEDVQEARTLEEIGNASNGFVSFIYADGNNMGGYIQKIKTPQEYQQFSRDIFDATERSVYRALAHHLQPHQLQNLTKPESQHRNSNWVHPFEIITIGGDDVLLIVPATKALEIAKTIGEEFETILISKERYRISSEASPTATELATTHRYKSRTASPSRCQLSMSIGLLTISYSTPIYYAEKLTNQLLKSAKKKAKQLKEKYHYYGGTVDLLTLKSVPMISSNIQAFREEGLIVQQPNSQTKLKLYAAPYTLHELGGLIETIKAFKQAEFPRSQLYQIRSLLEQGKRTAMINYRYFRVRLSADVRQLLQKTFEEAWCEAKNNNGNLAPWMYDEINQIYETIWRDMVDLYPFVEDVTTIKTSVEINP